MANKIAIDRWTSVQNAVNIPSVICIFEKFYTVEMMEIYHNGLDKSDWMQQNFQDIQAEMELEIPGEAGAKNYAT